MKRTKSIPLPPLGYLRQCLAYDRETGDFMYIPRPREHFLTDEAWNKWNGRWANKPATGRHKAGYLVINLDNKRYLAHRVAVKMTYGIEPDVVDHMNHCRDDNRIANLRDMSRAENGRYKKKTVACPACNHVFDVVPERRVAPMEPGLESAPPPEVAGWDQPERDLFMEALEAVAFRNRGAKVYFTDLLPIMKRYNSKLSYYNTRTIGRLTREIGLKTGRGARGYYIRDWMKKDEFSIDMAIDPGCLVLPPYK